MKWWKDAYYGSVFVGAGEGRVRLWASQWSNGAAMDPLHQYLQGRNPNVV